MRTHENTTLSYVGKKCKEFRKNKGYSQRDVAKDLGVSQVNISVFENGRNDSIIILMWYVERGFVL